MRAVYMVEFLKIRLERGDGFRRLSTRNAKTRMNYILATIMDTSLGTLLRFWGVFQFKQVQSLPHPTNNVGRVYPEFFFSEFQLCIGWREGELQENSEKVALF